MQSTQNLPQITDVLYIGSGYVGSLSAITMAIQNKDVNFTVFDIDKKLVGKWAEALQVAGEAQA